ncbi:MAG: phenylacetate--CoA ligase family protein [Deltaproteobacteria bacterium]|nr:phenylacetate--CoA ligase family protein [Deltaproteobacteria bacterium]
MSLPAQGGSLLRRAVGSVRIARAMLAARRFAAADGAAIRCVQERRIAGIVRHAFDSVPYYRDLARRLGCAPEDLRTAADLARLPLIGRRQLQEEPERFLSEACPRGMRLEIRSGGSSGAPRGVWHDAPSVLDDAGHGERHWAILRHLAANDRFRAMTIGSPRNSESDVRGFVRQHAIVPPSVSRSGSACDMTVSPEDVARAVAAARPDVLLGYGSYLERVAQILDERYGREASPKVFAYGGDGMSPSGRARVVERLGAAVWTSYQAVESLKIGYECACAAGLHVHADLCVVRVVDAEGRDVGPGGRGEVVISNLVNRATVLLNYRLGDEVVVPATPCGCGTPLPLIGFPEGRVEDWFALPTGERVHTQRLRALFTDEREVWQYQLVQERPSSLRVALVVAERADRPALAGRVGRAIAGVVGPGVALSIDFVRELERTPTGKVRTVVRRSDTAQPATPVA